MSQKPELFLAYNAVKSELPKRYGRLAKIRARLREVKDLYSWRKFIIEMRKTDTKKAGEDIEKFLEKCLDEWVKMRTGGLFRSLDRWNERHSNVHIFKQCDCAKKKMEIKHFTHNNCDKGLHAIHATPYVRSTATVSQLR